MSSLPMWKIAFNAALIAYVLGSFHVDVASAAPPPSSTGSRIEAIRARNTVNCGVWPQVPGFATQHEGVYSGFEVDICRALAAAVLGDASKTSFIPLEGVREFLGQPTIDLVVRRLTWTLGREQANRVAFGPVVYFDGQGFLVPTGSGIESSAQLAGARICVINMERHPATLHNHLRDNGLDALLVLVSSDQEAEAAMRTHRCQAYSADITWLAAARSRFPDGAKRFSILPESISKEPLAPLVRAEDSDLHQVVKWAVFAMIEAEEVGLSSTNVGDSKAGSSRRRALMAVHPGQGVALGPGNWLRPIIAQVGNYGEVFDRNLGQGTPLGIDRGLNRLWNQGGLMYAPPLDR